MSEPDFNCVFCEGSGSYQRGSDGAFVYCNCAINEDRSRKLVHCTHCNVRTSCRVVDHMFCCDRCYPLIYKDHTGPLLDVEQL